MYIGAASLMLFAADAIYFKTFSSISYKSVLTGQNILVDSASGNCTRSAHSVHATCVCGAMPI